MLYSKDQVGMSVRLAGTRIFLEITQPKIIKLFLRADSDLRFRQIQLQEKYQNIPDARTDFCQARPLKWLLCSLYIF